MAALAFKSWLTSKPQQNFEWDAEALVLFLLPNLVVSSFNFGSNKLKIVLINTFHLSTVSIVRENFGNTQSSTEYEKYFT